MAQASRPGRSSATTRTAAALSGENLEGAEEGVVESLKWEIARLEALVSELRATSPSVARLADLAVWREREAFEEKTRRALVLLRRKDAKIRALGEAAARRRLKVDARLAAGGGNGGDGGGSGGGGEGGGEGERGGDGRGGDDREDEKSVVVRLEQCVQEREGEIDILLEEVKRLRSAQSARPVVVDGDGRDTAEPSMDESTSSQPPTAGADFFMQSDFPRESPEAARTADACARQGIQGEWRESPAAVDDLRAKVARLESALSAQTAALAQKDSVLGQASACHQRELKDSQEREATLGERVETLERLQDTARRTVLDREERLRQLEDRHSTPSNMQPPANDSSHKSATGPAGCFSRAGAGKSKALKDDSAGGRQLGGTTRGTEKRLEAFIGAQEWWLHLAAAVKRRGGHLKSREGEDATSRNGDGRGNVEGKNDTRGLRRLLGEQGLEIVALRQRVLKANVDARAKAREEEQRDTEDKRRRAAAESSLKTQKLAENARVAELEKQVAALSVDGAVGAALAAAREEVSALKLAVIRAEGDAKLHAQLLEDEKMRSFAALSRADDLQGEMDKVAVQQTLRGVSGGVSASTLIDHFAGTLVRQTHRVKGLEAKVRGMRTRCARLASLARGDPVDVLLDAVTRRVDGTTSEGDKCEDHNDEWAEAGVQEAAAAMEAGRRRALEEEVESLRQDVLNERRRADAGQRDATDELRRRTLAHPANGSDHDTDAATLRRKLVLASSEIEALRTNTKDLRRQIQSGYWLWQARDSGADERGNGGTGGAGGGKVGFSDGSSDAREVASMLKEVRITDIDCGEGGRGDASASVEVARLKSLLAEKNAQVSVLTSTVEALHAPTSFVLSPAKNRGGGTGHNADLHLGAVRDKHGEEGGFSESHAESAADVDGGVGILNHIGAQGLARHCVALAVRLTSTMAREGAAERRADRLAAEMEVRERKMRAAEVVETDLSRRNRALEKNLRKTAEALSGTRAESSVRLQEAGEEASQLRSALRDAELGAEDAQQRLASARAEGHALAAELQTSRERHRDDIARLSKEHDTRIKECTDRLFVGASPSQLYGPVFEEGGGAVRKTILVSPVVSAISELAAQWRTWVATEDEKRRYRRRSTAVAQAKRCPEDNSDSGLGDGGGSYEQQQLVTSFLRETATRLDTECSRAVRHARALEWELRGARQEALDTKMTLEEVRTEAARLSARTAAAEAAVAAASFDITPPGRSYSTLPADLAASSLPDSSGGVRFGFSVTGRGGGGGGRGEMCRGMYTVAVVSLLEKRLAAALQDLVSSRAAKSAAEAGESAAASRAEAAEADATAARAAADVLSDELERYKSSVSSRIVEEAAGWRREIRSELGRWWQDDLMPLHNGVALDWGSAGAADEAAEIWTTRNGTTPTRTPLSRGGSFIDDRYAKEDPVNVGISGKGAMAQALIAGRAEQAALEERVRASEHRLARVRGEAVHLRAILERWHGDFVMPASQKRRRCSEVAGARKGAVEGKELLERKLLAATADLLGVRDEAAGLRGEIVALQGLVARLREDENEARETAGRRVESARETVRRRVEGDLRDAAERLVEERLTFKSQLGAAHADILRLGAETAELERQNRELVLARTEGPPLDWRNSPEGTPGGRRGAESSARGMVESGKSSAGERHCLGDVESVSGEGKRERALRMEVEEEREALRRMCNGLAVDLKAAVEARADAEDDREALVQEAAKADARAKMAGLARENQETALKDLGRLLEVAREAATEGTLGRRGERDHRLNAAVLSTWDYPKEEAQRFARFMIAAKVTQADLLRRLQEAGASEADLRHMLRRRDIRIEELKREQEVAGRLATSSGGGGMPRSTLVDSFAGSMNARQTAYAVGATGSGLAADTGKTGSAAERAAKEVALAAAVNRLELELAEAAARGDVGDAAVRTAERLAHRLFPKAAGVHGEDGRKEECHLCGRLFKSERRDTSLAGSQARGLSFLMPSTVVERKATGAGEEADGPQRVDAAAQTMHTPTAVCDSVTGGGNFDPVAVESDGGDFAARAPSVEAHVDHGRGQSSTSICAESEEEAEHGDNVPVVSQGLSTGLRSIEAHLERLEAVASGGLADGTDAADGRVRSSPPGGKSEAIEWALAQVVHDLRTQVAGLRDQAEATAELLNAERAGKDDLEEETLRLRTELLKQQRSYWRATATLKNRYERALHDEGTRKQSPSTATGSRQTMLAIENIENRELRGSVDSVTAELGGEDVRTPRGTRDTTDATGSSDEGIKEAGVEQLRVRLLEESLEDVRDQLRSREQELRDIRTFHVKEAREAKMEIDRAVGAQQARVGTLEGQLRRVRKKVKAMARPKPTRVYGRGMYRERVVGAGGDYLAIEGSPLSIDELLNMLAAADEEVFEAKGRMQRLEHELRAKTAEAKALLESETTVPEDESVGATADDCAGGQSSTVGNSATLSPTAAACFRTSALSVVSCTARLAYAEAEIERLRDEGLAASEVAIVAQREASSLRLAANRRMVDRADKGRSREKELRRQLSAYKREVNRLRLADVRVGAFLGADRDRRSHRGGEPAVGEEMEEVLSKTRAQLDAIREESERRGRAIVTLRATKTSLSEDLDRWRQEAADLEAKLVRALTDVGVKSNAVKALRSKVSTLEADVENARKSETVPMTGSACIGVVENATVAVDSGDVAREGSTRNDAAAATMRELRTECDRLRASMRSRQGSLSKQGAEIEAQATELERLEAEAGGLRAAVARKDDACRVIKKQLASVREEFESFKESSGRWQADAEAKWRQLKRASESAVNEAKTCRRAGDAAERELATLKAAFRSFLKTLWDDMRHRPDTLATFNSTRPLPTRREKGAEESLGPRRLVPSGTGDGTVTSPAGASLPIPTGFVVVKPEDGKRDVAGAADADHSPKTNGGQFAELTEAEVSDIMLALSGDSCSQPFPGRFVVPPVPPDIVDPASATHLFSSSRGAALMSPPLDREFEEEEAFSARIESALEGQNTSAALTDIFGSMHAHNFSEVAAGAGGGGPLVRPQEPPPPPNAQADSLTTWAERRTGVTQAPGPSDANVSLERWPHAQMPGPAVSEVLLGSGDGRGDRGPGVLLSSVARNAPSCSALDGAAVFTFGGNPDSLMVEDLM